MKPLRKIPPLGLAPRFTYAEHRMLQIQRAMNRHMAEKLPVPEEWIKEYNKLANLNQTI
jgi:hypothetical protein